MKLKLVLLCVLGCLLGAESQDVAEAETVVEETAETVAWDSEAGTTTVDPSSAEDGPPPQDDVVASEADDATEESVQEEEITTTAEVPVQSGPFIDLLGPALLSLEMTGPTTAQLNEMLTNDALRGKKVVGLYFSADWCGPCRQFTPDLVKFYEKVNKRRRDDFEIVWVSRCRDVQSYGQYFTEMKWLALPPQEAMGERGQWLGEKYGVKSIPSLVLLDDVGNVITKDARNQIPKDKAGIGFPWRNPLSTLYMTLFPKTLRHMIKSSVASVGGQLLKRIQSVLRPPPKVAA